MPSTTATMATDAARMTWSCLTVRPSRAAWASFGSGSTSPEMCIRDRCVGLGGFIGSVGRYLLGLVPVEGDFPLMTFAVNFAGAVLIGAVFEAATEGSGLPDNAVLFLKTGVCGGFTTFSAFSLETLALLERGKYATGALYACGSVLACLAGVVIGRLAVRGVRAALTGSAAA